MNKGKREREPKNDGKKGRNRSREGGGWVSYSKKRETHNEHKDLEARKKEPGTTQRGEPPAEKENKSASPTQVQKTTEEVTVY